MEVALFKGVGSVLLFCMVLWMPTILQLWKGLLMSFSILMYLSSQLYKFKKLSNSVSPE